jgi:hypothetical protein
MADDINKKGGKVNGVAPKAIQEMARQYDKSTEYEASLNDEKLQRLVNKAAELEEKFQSSAPGTSQQQILAEQLAYAEEEAHKYSLSVDQALTAKSNKVLSRSLDVYSKSGNINRRTTTMSGQQSYRSAARASGGMFRPTNAIEADIQSDIEAASALGISLADEARGLKPGASADSIRERAAGLSDYEARIAQNKALLKIQGREGYSTEKLTNRGEDLDRDVGEFLKRKKIETKIASGDVGSYKDEMASLNSKRDARNQAQADYEKAIETGASGVEDFAEKLHKANEALDEQVRIVKGMSDKGGGGGGIFGKYAGAMQFAQMGFQALGAVAGATNTIAVDQDITQMNNRGQFAKMGNAIYDKADAAVRGHSVDAMLDIIGSDAFTKQYGDANKKFTNVAKGVESVSNVGASVLAGVGKGAAIGGAAGFAVAGIGAVPGAIGGAVIGGVTALANSSTDVTNVAYGNEGAASSINSYMAAKNLTAEERHIRAQQMQAFYNQGLGLYSSTMGLGSGSEVQSQLMNAEMLQGLAANGISPEMSVQLSGMLGQAGSMSAVGGIDMIRGAGRAGQLGQMGREEYIGAASRLVAAGGQNSDLEDIIAAATTKGMDNSKNIAQMVDATLGLSSGLASIGIGGTSTVADMLGASSQFLIDQGVNKNLATGAAAQGIQDYNKGITDTGFNLGNILERGGLRNMKSLRGASTEQMNNLTGMSLEQIAVLQGGGTEAKNLANELGISNLVMKDGKMNQGLLKNIGREAFGGMLANKGLLGTKQGKELLDNFGADENHIYSDEAKAAMYGVGGERTVRLAGGTIKAKGTIANVARQGSFTETMGAQRGASQVAQGEKESGGFANLEKAMSEVSKAIDPAKWGDEVKKAANKFEIPAANFLAATGKFDTAVQRLIDHQNKMMDKMGELRKVDVAPSKPKR